MRVAVDGAVLLGIAAAATRLVVRPARRAIGLDALAAQLEHRFSLSRDEVRSAVCFQLSGSGGAEGSRGAEAMTARVVADAEKQTRRLSFANLMTVGPLIRRMSVLAAVLVVVCAVFVADGQWLRTGYYRYVFPYGALEWPRRVEILQLTGDARVPMGESHTARVRIVRGDRPGLRPVLQCRDRGGRTAFSMEPTGKGDYQCTLPSVLSDLHYWVEAGDATTAASPTTIRVIRRPAVADAQAEAWPPPYVAGARPASYDLTLGPARAVPGGEVLVTIRASKAIARDPQGRPKAWMQFPDGSELAMVPVPEMPETFSAMFECDTDPFAFRVRLTDTEGIESRGGRQYRITVAPDRPPDVMLDGVRPPAEVTRNGIIPLQIRVEDDFGVTGLWVEASVNDGPRRRTNLGETLKRALRRDRTRVTAAFEWAIASLNPDAGDVVHYTIIAADNFAHEDRPHQEGRSPPMRLQIISPDDYRARLRKAFAQFEAWIRHVVDEQKALRDRIADAGRERVGEPASPATSAGLGRYAETQDRLARRVREIAGRCRRLRAEIERNPIGDDDLLNRAARGSADLAGVADGPMASARAALAEAGDSPLQEDLPTRVARVSSHQDEAVRTLEQVLRLFGRWGDFQDVAARTRRLLEDQQSVQQQTATIGQRAIGERFDRLDATLQQELLATARRQRRLAEDVDRVLSDMDRLAGRGVRETALLQAAIRDASEARLVERMREAARAVGENRSSAAGRGQQAATHALSLMVGRLREGQTAGGGPGSDQGLSRSGLAALGRALQALRERQAEVAQDSARIVEAVVAHGRVTRADARRALRLAYGQNELRERATHLGGALASSPVGRWILDRITREMSAAASALQQRALNDSLVAGHRRILQDLDTVLDVLRQLASAVRRAGEPGSDGGGSGSQGGPSSGMPSAAELLLVLALQKQLNERTIAAADRLDSAQPSEQELRMVASLGQDQRGLCGFVDAIRQPAGEPAEAVVRTASLMRTAEQRLAIALDPGPGTQQVQQQIVEALDAAIAQAGRGDRVAYDPDAPPTGERQAQARADGDDGRAGTAGDPAATGGDSPLGAAPSESVLRETRQQWGHLPQRDREAIIQSMQDDVLEQYREQIDQYYRALAELGKE
jgi:hypothetical protein